jgi:hypothetical protein
VIHGTQDFAVKRYPKECTDSVIAQPHLLWRRNSVQFVSGKERSQKALYDAAFLAFMELAVQFGLDTRLGI